MKKLLMSLGILLCCALSAPIFAQVAAPTLSPAGGTYSSAQTVTISCASGMTATYTLDGSPPNIASTEYTSPITVSTTQTLNAICSDTQVYLPETQTSMGNISGTGIGYKCVTLNAQTYGSLSCESGGGVGSYQPTNVTLSFGSTEAYTQTSTNAAQSLVPFFGSATSGGSGVCTACDHMAQDKWVEATGSGTIQNNEMDMIDYNSTYNINHQIGLQSNEQSGTMQWQIDSGAGRVDPATGQKWFNTGVKACVPISKTAYCHVALEAHWTNGDTSVCNNPSGQGNGCTYYDRLTVNGVGYSLTSLGGQPNKTTTYRNIIGNQDQLDATSAGGTIGRNIQHNTVAAAIGAASSVTTATYTISGTPVVATPTASPAAGLYSSTQTVTLSDATSGAGICYATNGTAATATGSGCTNGTLYSSAIPVASSQTINAVAFLSGSTTSNPLVATYTIGTPQLGTPSASPSPGTYATAQTVTLTFPASSTGCYTTDGTTPAATTAGTCSHGTTYSTALTVSATETIKAIATRSGYTNSDVFSGTYTIGSVSPVSGNIDYTQIKAGQRLGTGAFFQMAASGVYTIGHVPVFDANGNLVDSGGFPLTNPMTTVGDLIVGGTSGAAARLAAGTSGYALISNGPGTAPSWQTFSGSGCPLTGCTYTGNVIAPNFIANSPATLTPSASELFYSTSSIAGGFFAVGPSSTSVPSISLFSYSSDASLSMGVTCVYSQLLCTFITGIATPSVAINGGTPITSSSTANSQVVTVAPGTRAIGSTTLSSGTVTVSNSAACTPSSTCIYKLQNCGLNSSTAIGTPSVTSVTAGTSFVIKSETSAAATATGDKSIICWQIN